MGATDETEVQGDESSTAPDGEGIEAGSPAQMSIYDGAGNETVVAMADNEQGRRAQGTGATAEEALEDAKKGDSILGDGFAH